MTQKQWPNSKKPSDSPPRTVYDLLSVLNWVTPALLTAAKILLLAVPCHLLILVLWLLVATN